MKEKKGGEWYKKQLLEKTLSRQRRDKESRNNMRRHAV